jgi:PglZ domain
LIEELCSPNCYGRTWVADESGLFAWIPTLTSVSRQSIFAGDPPFFFATSLDTTRKEEQHWKRFWDDRGLRQEAVAYVCQGTQESDQSLIARVQERIDRPHCSMLGIVIGTIDQMLHGVVTGTDGLHASVRHWGQRGALRNLIEVLLARGFEIVLRPITGTSKDAESGNQT